MSSAITPIETGAGNFIDDGLNDLPFPQGQKVNVNKINEKIFLERKNSF
jgi:hypothetical protein